MFLDENVIIIIDKVIIFENNGMEDKMTEIHEIDFNTTEECRKGYILNTDSVLPDTIPGVRQIIIDSWRRSQKTCSPHDSVPPILKESQYEAVLAANKALVEIALPYLTDVFSFIKNTYYVINLTDADGYQLKEISGMIDENGKIKPDQHGNGRHFSETCAGTTGIGLSLFLDEPAIVYGPEHYLDLYQNLICYGSPIHDPSGKQIGCLNITGPIEDYNPLLMGLLSVAVNGIEKEYRLNQMNQVLNTIINSGNRGMILLSKSGQILHFNSQSASILQVRNMETGHFLSEYIRINDLFNQFLDSDGPAENHEFTIMNRNGVLLDLTFSLQFITYPAESVILSFTTQEYIHSLANQIAGFSAEYTFDSIYGHSASVQAVRRAGRMAAQSGLPVLLCGEDGTGKDILAQSIHNASSLADGPFVSIKCETMPLNSLRKELLGDGPHSPGKLLLAKNGTLYLDHINALSSELQTALFEYIQSESVEKPRIIASVSGNLYSDVQSGLFRTDLYYYLNMMNIVLPPLREHPEDIPECVSQIIRQMMTDKQLDAVPAFDHQSMSVLMNYDWPGNSRELAAVTDRVLRNRKNDLITISDLPSYLIRSYYVKQTNTEKETETEITPEAAEYKRIHNALKAAKGNVKKAALALNIPISTLYRKAAKYNIIAKDYKRSSVKK